MEPPCFIDCLEGELPPIDISIRENLFSVNRQLEDANGRRLFERSDGSTTTDVAQGIAPALDGEIKFLGASAIEKLLEKVDEKVGESLKQEREERQRAEIGQAEAEKDLAKATSDEERQALNQIIDERKREAAEASKNEKSLTKKKAASGASTSLCVSSGIGVEACFGEKEGDLLGWRPL